MYILKQALSYFPRGFPQTTVAMGKSNIVLVSMQLLLGDWFIGCVGVLLKTLKNLKSQLAIHTSSLFEHARNLTKNCLY